MQFLQSDEKNQERKCNQGLLGGSSEDTIYLIGADFRDVMRSEWIRAEGMWWIFNG